ncbi:MAG: protein kinase [Vicinamibacteria bacterium]
MSEQAEPKKDAPSPSSKELSGRIGKYDIVSLLGKGAMGQVYLARDSMLEREVALKVMVSTIADDPELMKRFEREAKAVARMSHPNVVNVFDLGYHTDGSPYMAMELLKGQDLAKAMRTPPPMSVERKANVLVQVLTGLAHAHQAGIVHRDIKPANIFLNADGTVKIMDFGVARLTTASMTGTGSIVGTADYMSPEQVRGAKVDGRSDLFSVGCMLYELLAGRRPFRAENLMAIFYKITHEDPDWNLIPAGEEYDALLPILHKSLAKDLAARHQTAYEFATELRGFLQARATSASGNNLLEGLVDIDEPATVGPQAVTELGANGPTLVEGEPDGTVDLGSGARTARQASTVRPRTPTTVAQGAPTVLTGDRTARGTRPPGRPAQAAPAMRPAPAPPAGTSPAVYAAIGIGVLALAGVGYLLYSQISKPAPVPPTTLAAAPPTTLAPAPPTLSTPPPTAAPPPTFADTGSRALRAAQSAFRSGDYDRAVRESQTALKEDPANADAKRMLDNAMSGQRARARFDAADAALRAGDFAKAQAEASEGRNLAAWDGRGPEILNRIRDAQQRAEAQAQQQKQQLAQAEVAGLLAQASQALSTQKYDQAIVLYDQVLAKDPSNQSATLGKTSAVAAKAVSTAAANAGTGQGRPAAPAGKRFNAGKTEAKGQATGGSVPAGFDDSPEVKAQSATQAADLPGRLLFEVDPDSPKPGDKYTVRILIQNDGSAPIQIRDMIVTTTVNGKRAQGPVPPQVKEVAPRQKATLLSLPDVWRDDTSAWTMEVLLRTVRGESYKNKLDWK